MSSPGSQWRIIRHYLSMTNLHSEVEKLVQKLKPASAEQWESLIQRFEKAVTARLNHNKPELDTIKSENILQAADAFKPSGVFKSSTLKDASVNTEVTPNSRPNPAVTASPSVPLKTSNANVSSNPGVTLNTEVTSDPGVAKNIVQSSKDVQANKENEMQEKTSSEWLSLGYDWRGITISSLMEGIRLKKDMHFGILSEPSVQASQPVVSKTSIHSRTAYVISAIVTAETEECLYKRTENFIDHLKQYPEARDYAIKEGGVRVLLRVQTQLRPETSTPDQLGGLVKEALALMGHTGPCKGPGPNILSIDGGGIRGLIAIEILRHLERLTGRRVNELFDYIVGVSTGAIIAAVLSSGVGNLDTASDMYHTLSKKMFGNTSLIGGTSRLVWTHSYYDTEAWESLLKENLNELTLTQCNRHNTPKMALVSCVVNAGSRLSPFIFRTYETPYRVRSVFPGTARALVWEAVRASAAAPTYFNEFRHRGLLHQDGGIMVNNPSGLGLHEARLLYGPDALRNGCLVSVGTGKALNKHLDYQLLSKGLSAKEASGTSWKDKFNKILDSATDTEGIHLVLNDLLPPGGYFRLNPPLMNECAMDEIDPEKLNGLIVDTDAYLRRNRHKLQQAALMLTRKRSIGQRIGDYIQHTSHVMGVTQGQ